MEAQRPGSPRPVPLARDTPEPYRHTELHSNPSDLGLRSNAALPKHWLSITEVSVTAWGLGKAVGLVRDLKRGCT
jgi:hypothetical protein